MFKKLSKGTEQGVEGFIIGESVLGRCGSSLEVGTELEEMVVALTRKNGSRCLSKPRRIPRNMDRGVGFLHVHQAMGCYRQKTGYTERYCFLSVRSFLELVLSLGLQALFATNHKTWRLILRTKMAELNSLNSIHSITVVEEHVPRV